MTSKLVPQVAKKHRPKKSVPLPKDLPMLIAILTAGVVDATKKGADGLIDVFDAFLDELIAVGSAAKLASKSVLKKIGRMSSAERKILNAFGDAEWVSLMGYARKLSKSFKGKPLSRQAAIKTLKGIVAEDAFYKSPAYLKVLTRSQGLAKKLEKIPDIAVDPDSVRLVRDIVGLTANEAGSLGFRELTDGMIVATRADGRLQVLAVFEMKSPSNIRDLARRKSKQIELAEEQAFGKAFKKEGQLSGTFERLDQQPIRLDGKEVNEKVVVSKKHTEILAVLPKGKTLSMNQKKLLEREFPTFAQLQQEIRNDVLDDVAEHLLKLVNP